MKRQMIKLLAIIFIFCCLGKGAVAIAQDYTLPVITNVQVVNITANSATICWETDENAISAVGYSIDESYANHIILWGEFVTRHTVNLTELAQNQVYNFVVASVDASGNQAVSYNFTFQTLPQVMHVVPNLYQIVMSRDWQHPVTLPFPLNYSGWEDSVVADYSAPNRIYFVYVPVDIITYVDALIAAYQSGRTPDPQEFKKNYIIGPERPGSSGMLNIDIYEATFSSQGWQVANSSVNDNSQNSIFEEHSPSLPLSGDVMYLEKVIVGVNGDISKSVKNEQGLWSIPVLENVINEPGTVTEDNPHVSADGNTIFFDSDRAGGKGGRDLYFSVKDGNGEWTTPQPIESLNTPFKEWQPFITKDGKTLYFSSNTLDGVNPSMLSIFKSEYKDNAWGPRELVVSICDGAGDLVNGDIIGIGEPSISADGTTLYFLYVFKREDGYFESNIAAAKICDETPPTVTNITDNPDPFYVAAKQVAAITYTLNDNLSNTLNVSVYIYKNSEKGSFLVRVLGPHTQDLGIQSAVWDGKNSSGEYVKDGAYQYQIEAIDNQGNAALSALYDISKKTEIKRRR